MNKQEGSSLEEERRGLTHVEAQKPKVPYKLQKEMQRAAAFKEAMKREEENKKIFQLDKETPPAKV
jgi:hypothetical protein